MQINTDSILRGDMVILADSSFDALRLFKHVFRNIPQSLPLCTEGAHYRCGGETWRFLTPVDAARAKVDIVKASTAWETIQRNQRSQ